MFTQKNFERVKRLSISNYHIIILVYLVSIILTVTSLAFSLISDTLTKCLLVIPFALVVGTFIISIYFIYFISEKDIKSPTTNNTSFTTIIHQDDIEIT